MTDNPEMNADTLMESTDPLPPRPPAVNLGATAVAAAQSAVSGNGHATLDMLMDVTLQLSVELGRTRLSVRQVLDLQKGSVVELNRVAGDPVDVFVNDRLIARGEVVVVDDKFGVRVTELISPKNEEGEPAA